MLRNARRVRARASRSVSEQCTYTAHAVKSAKRKGKERLVVKAEKTKGHATTLGNLQPRFIGVTLVFAVRRTAISITQTVNSPLVYKTPAATMTKSRLVCFSGLLVTCSSLHKGDLQPYIEARICPMR